VITRYALKRSVLEIFIGWVLNSLLLLLFVVSAQGQWAKKADIPTRRNGASFLAPTVDEKNYVIGGSLGGLNDVATVEAYDPAADSWEQKADEALAEQFTNREEIVKSRTPVPTCYGIQFSLVYVRGIENSITSDDARVKIKNMVSPELYAKWQSEDASGVSMRDDLRKVFPTADVTLALAERVNLYPGRRSWGYNVGIPEIFGSLFRFILNDSPIQPATIRLPNKEKPLFMNLSVNNHQDRVEFLWSANKPSGGNAGGGHHYAQLGKWHVSGGLSAGFRVTSDGSVLQVFVADGTFIRWKLTVPDPDNITLRPRETLDLTQPPRMSITMPLRHVD